MKGATSPKEKTKGCSHLPCAKYWADTFNNAKEVHDILKIKQWISQMEATVQQAQFMPGGIGPSKPPQHEEVHDSNADGTTIKISSAPMFDFDEEDMEDVQQPPPSEEFMMVFNDDKSSGPQYSTSKPKAKKKKKECGLSKRISQSLG